MKAQLSALCALRCTHSPSMHTLNSLAYLAVIGGMCLVKTESKMSANNFTTTGELYKTHTAEYNLSVSILIVIGGLGATLFVCLILYTCYVIVVEMFHVATEACTWLVRKGTSLTTKRLI